MEEREAEVSERTEAVDPDGSRQENTISKKPDDDIER